MLSVVARRLTYLIAALFALFGAVMFVVPRWADDNFAWSVSPFLAMTIGAWYLGSAVFAWEGARIWRWPVSHGVLVYVWLFSVLQGLLLVIHADVVRTGEPLTWPYVTMLVVAAAASVAGAAGATPKELVADSHKVGKRTPRVVRLLSAVFVVAVAALAVPLVDGYDSPRSIWPGPLSLLSARAFAVFFGSLALSALALVVSGRLGAMVSYLRAAIPLNILILVAALVYIGQFDFGDHPGQFLYVGLYVVVLLAALAIAVYAARYRGGTDER